MAGEIESVLPWGDFIEPEEGGDLSFEVIY